MGGHGCPYICGGLPTPASFWEPAVGGGKRGAGVGAVWPVAASTTLHMELS